MATMIGTFAARAWWMASMVCGITPCSGATPKTTRPVTCAPVARTLRGLDGNDVLALDRLNREAKLVGDDLGGGEVDDLVDGCEDLRRHQLLDDLDWTHPQLLGQVLDGQRRREHDLALAVGLH